MILNNAAGVCEQPVVSVILPVYNCEAYINTCITSIFAQTEQNIEIIVLDDASTDSTRSCIEGLQATCPPRISLNLIRNTTNGGVTAARSLGLKTARGKYVFFIDSDDCITPDCLEKLRRLAEKHGAEVTCGSHKDVCGSIRIEQRELQNTQVKFYGSNEEILQAYCGKELPVFIWNKLILRSFFMDTGLCFEDSIINDEDQLWSFRLVMRAKIWVSSTEVTYFYRQDNPQSITSLSVRERRLRNYFSVLDCMWAEVRSNDGDSIQQKKLKTKAILNFTKQILWLLELNPDAQTHDLYAEFKQHNIIQRGSWVSRYIGFKYKVLSNGWGFPYPVNRFFNPSFLVNKKNELFS